MKVHAGDLRASDALVMQGHAPTLHVGGPCIMLEETTGLCYFGTVEKLPLWDKLPDSGFSQDAVAKATSPIGIDGPKFTVVEGWDPTSLNVSDFYVWILPDSPAVRQLVRMSIGYRQRWVSAQELADSRTKLFTGILAELIKMLVLPAPIKKIFDALVGGADLEKLLAGLKKQD